MPTPDYNGPPIPGQINEMFKAAFRKPEPEDLSAEISALRKEIAALRSDLAPAQSVILTGQEVVQELRRIVKGD